MMSFASTDSGACSSSLATSQEYIDEDSQTPCVTRRYVPKTGQDDITKEKERFNSEKGLEYMVTVYQTTIERNLEVKDILENMTYVIGKRII